MFEAIRLKGKIELKTGEYLVPSLGITVRHDGDVVEGLKSHKRVNIAGHPTNEDCQSTTGYAIILGTIPSPRAKVRCGTYGDENPPCWMVWK